MNITQSFLYTVCRVPLSLYEQRILLSVIVQHQDDVKNLYMANVMEKLEHHYDNVLCRVAIKDVLTKGSKHYDDVTDAIKSLQSKKFEFYNPDTGKWFCTPIIYNASHIEGQGVIKFYVARVFFDVLLDFTKGFRKYDFFKAMELESPYSCRMYALMNGQVRPIELKIDYLKAMFGVTERYKQTADFIKRVIDPARKELDAHGITSFTYSRVRKGSKVIALTLFPVIRQSQDKNALLAQLSTGWILDKELRIILVSQASFSVAELGGHKDLLIELAKIEAAPAITADIVQRAARDGKGKGWIINALRREVQAYKDAFPDENKDTQN